MSDKPIHVQVAKALGIDAFGASPRRPVFVTGRWIKSGWWRLCEPASDRVAASEIPHYDTDWSATGPLVEKYGLGVSPSVAGWSAWPRGSGLNSSDGQDAKTPLLAVCNLIIALGKAGKL